MKDLMTTNGMSSAEDPEKAYRLFEDFCHSYTLRSILYNFRQLCCLLRLKSNQLPLFYPKLKSRLSNADLSEVKNRWWKAQAIWNKLDKRALYKCYGGSTICSHQRVLIIGAGPCGLRTAIEMQLLGAKVVVIEKRDRFSRNNVLHLWPYNIFDLRGLAAKKFFGKFCAGSIDHISIRQLQCILLKVCCLLGVEVWENVIFEELLPPVDAELGWRAQVSPSEHPVSQFEFDVLIGADGKRNTLHGFPRKEFRGKLAIAITVNFINKQSEAENNVDEISGVAFIFHQKFFNDLYRDTGISLENIVYYKDDTHYFVMTANKSSLLQRGVIINNESDTARLLDSQNIDRTALFAYAREAADYATEHSLPHLDFAINHYGNPDVAMFDFTSMFQALNSCRVTERLGHRLITALVGDSLLEPFWPTGTGCPRGFFGGFDACWMLRSFGLGNMSTLEILAERESIYRLLAQTTPESINKDFASYTLDPHTRYSSLNTKFVRPFQVLHLYETDDAEQLKKVEEAAYSESNVSAIKEEKVFRRFSNTVSNEVLLTWLQNQVKDATLNVHVEEPIRVTDLTSSFKDGRALCAIIHHYRPDLIDVCNFTQKNFPPVETDDQSIEYIRLKLCFDILHRELGIPPMISSSTDVAAVDDSLIISYLVRVYECFRGEIPQRLSMIDELGDLKDDSQYVYNHQQFRRPDVKPRIMTASIPDLKNSSKKKKLRKTEASMETEPSTEPETTEGMFYRAKRRIAESYATTAMAYCGHTPPRKRRENRRARVVCKVDKRVSLERHSIKKDERFIAIERKFGGVHDSAKSRRNQNLASANETAKYRENKRPRDLRRAIGKIDKNEWNMKALEERVSGVSSLHPSKSTIDTKIGGKSACNLSATSVPKWSKAAFEDKFKRIKDKLDTSKSTTEGSSQKTFKEIDFNLAKLQRQLHEGRHLETGQRGSNRVSALAKDLLAVSHSKTTPTPIRASNPATIDVGFGVRAPENCYVCLKRVYGVERISAGGKYFHRSCFRCDYCNSLLRLGSYVFHREGRFAGKFFCIPHSTETSLEKFRFRHKADEIHDYEKRRIAKLNGFRNEELLSSLEAYKMRGATPERVEFETRSSVGENSLPNVIDEDEWEDRNFGSLSFKQTEDSDDVGGGNHKSENSKLPGRIDHNKSSFHDGSSGVQSSTSSVEDDRDIERPLTSNETHRLLSEWRKRIGFGGKMSSSLRRRLKICERGRSNTGKSGYDDSSRFESSGSDSSSAVSYVQQDEEDEINYGDCESDFEENSSEYSRVSSSFDGEDETARFGDEETEDGAPRKTGFYEAGKYRRRRHRNKRTMVGGNWTGSSLNSSRDKGLYQEEQGTSSIFDEESESNTECEFTDSEGKPNPFHYREQHEQLEIPKIVVVQPSSLSIQLESNKMSNHISSSANVKTSDPQKYRYKTPSANTVNGHELIVKTNSSTRRALNLKKNWASVIAAPSTTPQLGPGSKSSTSSDIDVRLKSLMDRLSNQQKLLRPSEDGPSSQMQHFLKKSFNFHGCDVPLNRDEVEEPPSEIALSVYDDVECLFVPTLSRTTTVDKTEGISSGDSQASVVSDSEYTNSTQNSMSKSDPNINAVQVNMVAVDGESSTDIPTLTGINQNGISLDLISGKEMDENSPINEKCDLTVYSVAGQPDDFEKISNPNTKGNLSLEEDIGKERLISNSDEVRSVFHERNPSQRLAKLNSLRKRQSSVVHEMILGRASAGRLRNSSVSNCMNVASQINQLIPSVSPLPSEDQLVNVFEKMNLPLIDDDGGSYVSKKAVSPGIGSGKKEAQNPLMKPTSLEENTVSSKSPKKSLFKSISDLFRPSSSNNATTFSNADGKNPVTTSLPRSISISSIIPCQPSTPPVPLSRNITLDSASMFDLHCSTLATSEDDCISGDEATIVMPNFANDLPPDVLDKIMKRSSKRNSHAAYVKRVRKAQDIQRQLDEIDVETKLLSEQGSSVSIVKAKNELIRRERELLVEGKQLELQDTSCRLELELRSLLLLDSRKSDNVARESKILAKLVEISEQREMLEMMMVNDRQRYEMEDAQSSVC